MTESTAPFEIAENIAATMPYTIYLAGVLGSVTTGSPAGFYFTALAIGNELLNHGFKFLSKRTMSTSLGARPPGRPSGCGGTLRQTNACRGCGIYYKGKPSTTWGFPSGHAQTIVFAAVFATLWAYGFAQKHKKQDQKNQLWWQIPIIWSLALFVCCQRSPAWSNCHSYVQIIAGALIGALIGFGSYELCNRYVSEKDFPAYSPCRSALEKASFIWDGSTDVTLTSERSMDLPDLSGSVSLHPDVWAALRKNHRPSYQALGKEGSVAMLVGATNHREYPR
jgi:membrane-associated phospholipid phosphatase